MFQYDLTEEIAEYLGGLINDRCVGDGIDDPPVPMDGRMVECKPHRSQRLAAACRNRQGEKSWRSVRL